MKVRNIPKNADIPMELMIRVNRKFEMFHSQDGIQWPESKKARETERKKEKAREKFQFFENCLDKVENVLAELGEKGYDKFKAPPSKKTEDFIHDKKLIK